jgi:ubiquinone biosynthesis protein UbiJ
METIRPLPEPLLRLLEQTVNRLLEMDPASRSGLASIAGKVIAIEFRNVGLGVILLPRADVLDVAAAHAGPVHVTIRGAPRDMLSYVAGSAPAAGSGMEIVGDIAVAERLQDILKGLDPDWEEALSGWVGDTAARKIGNLARAATEWARAAGRSTLKDADEYLRFEARVVPERAEVAGFAAAVDGLRDDVERLRARLDRLGRRAAGRGR